MRVLSKLTMLVLGGLLLGGCDTTPAPELPPAVGRPEGASQGPRAAVVVAVRGTAEIQPSQGLAFPAQPGQQLLRDDRIVTGEGSLVVVALHNQHVVRLSPGTLRVDMLAAFNERPAGDDLEQRFDQLLTPDERQDPALRGAIARVAGWNTRMTAAETIAPQPKPQPRPVERLEQPDEGRPEPPTGAATKTGAPAPVDPRATDDAPASDRLEPARADEDAPERKPAKDRPSKSAPELPGGAGGPPTPLESGPPSSESESHDGKSKKASESKAPARLPDFVSFRPDAGGEQLRVGLPAPLAAVRASLAACAGVGGKIRVHVVGKKISELKVDGAAGKCEVGLIGKPVGLADGWLELQVQ